MPHYDQPVRSQLNRPRDSKRTSGKPKVALVMKSLAHEFFRTMAEGAQQHQAVNAASYDPNVNGIRNETDLAGTLTPHEPKRRSPTRREPGCGNPRAGSGDRRSSRGSGVHGANFQLGRSLTAPLKNDE
jgi:hypothetical protein